MHKNRAYVNEEEYKRLRSLGYSKKKIAKLFGVSSSYISAHFKGGNLGVVPVVKRDSKISDKEKEKINNMHWDCEMTLSAIGENYNCSASTIYKRMKDWGLETRGRGIRTIASIKATTTLSGDFIHTKMIRCKGV